MIMVMVIVMVMVAMVMIMILIITLCTKIIIIISHITRFFSKNIIANNSHINTPMHVVQLAIHHTERSKKRSWQYLFLFQLWFYVLKCSKKLIKYRPVFCSKKNNKIYVLADFSSKVKIIHHQKKYSPQKI